jgi:tetratricopeptide (TPR) repeat protein
MRRADPQALEWWRLARGEAGAASRLVTMAQEAATRDTLKREQAARTIALLSAWIAEGKGAPDAGRLTEIADSLNRGVGDLNSPIPPNLLARLYRRQGKPERALTMIRRRELTVGQPFPGELPPSLRLEGQLAAEAGDREGAIRAYQNYLMLRPNPDPPLIPQRDSVKAELAALTYGEGKR